MAHHHEGDDLIVRKLRVGDMDNNVYVLECPATHESLIVDACQRPDEILAACAGTTVVGILQTHGHADHVHALAELKKRLSVPLHAHPGDVYPVGIDDELADGDVVPFGRCHATVLHTPGHTQGGVCFLAEGHLLSGDTLFPGGPGNTGGNAQAFAQIIAAIECKLFTLPDDTPVYPGHGADTTIGAEKPHLQEWMERGW